MEAGRTVEAPKEFHPLSAIMTTRIQKYHSPDDASDPE
jgi:hypothetical protein